jgi:hypothetical protein
MVWSIAGMFVRVVKEMDLKSIVPCTRRFEPYSIRIFLFLLNFPHLEFCLTAQPFRLNIRTDGLHYHVYLPSQSTRRRRECMRWLVSSMDSSPPLPSSLPTATRCPHSVCDTARSLLLEAEGASGRPLLGTIQGDRPWEV